MNRSEQEKMLKRGVLNVCEAFLSIETSTEKVCSLPDVMSQREKILIVILTKGFRKHAPWFEQTDTGVVIEPYWQLQLKTEMSVLIRLPMTCSSVIIFLGRTRLLSGGIKTECSPSDLLFCWAEQWLLSASCWRTSCGGFKQLNWNEEKNTL